MNLPDLHILLVEDNPGDARLIKAFLAEVAEIAYRVEQAERLSAALAAIESHAGPFDAILLDLSLPDSHGFETFARVQAHAWQVPIIVLTGLDDEALAVQAAQLGAQDYLVKGLVDGHLLSRAIRYAIQRKQTEEELRRVNRTFRVISDSNQTLIYAESEADLLRDICRIAVETGGYHLAWVGLLQHDRLQVVAQAGVVHDSHWYAAQCEAEPAVTAIQTRRPDVRRYSASEITHHGVALALPLLSDKRLLGVLTIYSTNSAAFDNSELDLLNELSGDLAYGLVTLRTRFEHRQAEAEIRRLAAVINQAAETIMITDLNADIIYANPFFEKATGYTVAEAIGRNPRLLKSGYHDVAFYQSLWATLTAGQTYTGVMTNRRKDGSLFHEEATIFPIKDDAGRITHYAATKRDITERWVRERQLQAIADVATALRIARTFAEMLPVIINSVARVLQVDAAALLMPGPSGSHLIVSIARGTWEHLAGRLIAINEGVTAQILATRRPYVHNEVHLDTRLTRPELFAGLQAAIGLPLIADDQVIGLLWVARKPMVDPRFFARFTDDDVRLLSAVGDIAANALHRAHITESLEQRVTERTLDLARANAKLLELDRLKSKFVSDVSHELRTPITSLKLNAELLQHGKPEKQAKYVAAINEQADRLSRLVDEILDLSRLERDARQITFELLDMNEVVREGLTAQQPRADSVGLTLEFLPDVSLPLVMANRFQLVQVIANLVANAINYTPAGYVRVTTCQDNHRVGVIVTDTGLGIERADVPHLFERFYRGANTRHIRGSGLGLSIVKEIVDLHSGQIEVDSQIGVGTTFKVWLPCATS